ncbi:MAG: asparagine synthase-related protein, partial [Erythrobacter sp.]|nr:asparagine synthase-related protein [Erythrobacter sp.]
LRAQCGIEGRHPLFSREFITFSAATPEATRLRGAQQKFTHRIALAGLLPEPVLTRTSKAEFGCVLETQLPAINLLLGHGGAPATDRLVDPAGLQDLLTVAQSHRVDQSWKWPIWSSTAYMALISDWGKDLAGFE